MQTTDVWTYRNQTARVRPRERPRPDRLRGRGARRLDRQDRRGDLRSRRELHHRRHRALDLRQEGHAPCRRDPDGSTRRTRRSGSIARRTRSSTRPSTTRSTRPTAATGRRSAATTAGGPATGTGTTRCSHARRRPGRPVAAPGGRVDLRALLAKRVPHRDERRREPGPALERGRTLEEEHVEAVDDDLAACRPGGGERGRCRGRREGRRGRRPACPGCGATSSSSFTGVVLTRMSKPAVEGGQPGSSAARHGDLRAGALERLDDGTGAPAGTEHEGAAAVGIDLGRHRVAVGRGAEDAVASAKTSVLTEPAAAAISSSSSQSASTACLCGIVTFAPAKPAARSPRTASPRSSGGVGSGT